MKFYATIEIDMDAAQPTSDAERQRLARWVDGAREAISKGIEQHLFEQAYRARSVQVASERDVAFNVEHFGRPL